MSRLLARWVALFSRERLDRELVVELDTHRELLAEEFERRGASPEEARRAARIALGGEVQLVESHREVRSLAGLLAFWRDLRFAARALVRDAGFTVFAILIAGLGVGASTVVWSLLDALWLRPLPLAEPERLVWVAATAERTGDLSNETLRVNVLRELRERSRSFSGLAAYFAFYQERDLILAGDGSPERLTAVPVSSDLFGVLGVEPILGRTFTEEEARGDLPLVVLSERFWSRRFHRDPDIVGQTLSLGGRPKTVIGVIPFDFGTLFAPGQRVDVFRPLPLIDAVDAMGNTLAVVGRLAPGATLASARAESGAIAPAIGARHGRPGLELELRSLDEHVRGGLRPALSATALGVGLVLAIVWANLASLALARAATRQREQAIRLALGGRRGHLVRHLIAEGALLAGASGAVAWGVAAAALAILERLPSLDLVLRESIRLDVRAALFCLTATAVTGGALALAPAVLAPIQAIQSALRRATAGASVGRGFAWLRSGLVIAEVAFACVLIVGAALLVRSLGALLAVELGFRPEQVVALRLELPPDGGANPESRWDEILRAARSVPGVHDAGLADVLPLGGDRSWGILAPGSAATSTREPESAFVRVVSDGYLRALGVSLRAGRDVDARDRPETKPVILVNETLARRLWPGADPLGKIVTADVDREVVGVVGDVRHLTLEQEPGGEIYLPIRQTRDFAATLLVVRSSVAPAPLAAGLRSALAGLVAEISPDDFQVLADRIARASGQRRTVAALLSGFAAFAALLSALGAYGVISYSVAQRRQEIGIRLALGASPATIRRQTLAHTLALVGVGIVLGLGLSFALGEGASHLLYGVGPHDPPSFLAAVAILAGAAIVAGSLPAHRAARVDPLAVLKVG